MVARRPITIRKERFYPHPPEDVWAAITDPHALAEWLEPNDHQPIVGHKFQFRCDPGLCGSGVTECEVLEAEPPVRLVWSWVHVPKDPNRPRPKPMIISWTLSPKDGGTMLILEHSGAENIDWLTRNMMRVGWGFMMKKMIARVLSRVHEGTFTPGAIPQEKRYYTCNTIPEKYIR
ncbi:SRPBCC family protein [Gimesia aquarii]|uniref:Activator of Hsp90 ATPase homologue 1/2-like C-terminal domain-containing protein n=1 Tax=Gimesia aquarii TaxID=2527964 RepID=A0A517WP67_9PLAN|nr:SRPBCC domain-containing protein [Gimesia aquarii]QDU07039.1 hypothetical protein V202x_03840 [Gimesia aquarii]